MHTQWLRPRRADPRDPAIQQAAQMLRRGQLVAFPTETVYGLGADAGSAAAVAAVYRVKGRPADNPLIVHLADAAGAGRWGELDAAGRALLAAFWPGPLTVVLRARPPGLAAARGRATVALRMPDHPLALALLRACGRPLAAPSANLSGRPSPTTAEHVREDLAGKIPLILDGGPCGVGIESTVVDLSEPLARVLRPGQIDAAALGAVLGRPVLDEPGALAHRSPGTRYRHYRPRVPVALLEPAVDDAALAGWVALCRRHWPRLALLAPPAQAMDGVVFRAVADSEALQAQLYGLFRELEQAGVGLILVQAVTARAAVMERLRRAASVVLSGAPEARALAPLVSAEFRNGS